jgi:hypothetical protein
MKLSNKDDHDGESGLQFKIVKIGGRCLDNIRRVGAEVSKRYIAHNHNHCMLLDVEVLIWVDAPTT